MPHQESGGMTGELLKQVLMHMDDLKLFAEEREAGNQPFLLLDGHESRFSKVFLEYINQTETKWQVCVGVPYGTSYWQVGDSEEQNGSFKMALTKLKEEMINTRIRKMIQDMQIAPTDIIPLVNNAWDVSFARMEKNKKAIYERGWFPFNRNLLLHPDIRASMTEEDIKEEKRWLDADDDDEDEEQSSGETSIATEQQQQLQSPHHSPPSTNTNFTTNTNQPVFAEANLHKNILKPEDVKFNYESTPAVMFLQTLV